MSPGAPSGNVVYVGTGVRAPKRGLDPYAGLDVRGKWILVHAGARPARGVARDTLLGTLGVDYTTVLDEARGAWSARHP